MIKILFTEVLEHLLNENYFSTFSYRKRDCRFIKNNELGFEAIEFQYWDGFDLLRNKRSLVIKPLYLKRFHILHTWFEKYSFKTKADQRDNFSIGFDGGMLNKKNEFHFLLDNTDFQKDFDFFSNEVIKTSDYVFCKIKTLQNLFEHQIIPLLKYQSKLPDVGADWIFEYLSLTRIVEPLHYVEIKEMILLHVETLYNKGELNIKEYYPKFTEITEYLEILFPA